MKNRCAGNIITISIQVIEMTTAKIKITGTVKWFNGDKGFGFIVAGGVDYFIHYRAIKKNLIDDGGKQLLDGQTVVFTPTVTAKGNQAEDVEVIEVDGNV